MITRKVLEEVKRWHFKKVPNQNSLVPADANVLVKITEQKLLSTVQRLGKKAKLGKRKQCDRSLDLERMSVHAPFTVAKGWGTNLRGDLECFNTALEDRKLEAYATHVGHASSLPAITPTACCGF